MSDLYRLSEGQMARLEPYFPKSHGRPWVDDRRVLSGIVFVNRNGLRWWELSNQAHQFAIREELTACSGLRATPNELSMLRISSAWFCEFCRWRCQTKRTGW